MIFIACVKSDIPYANNLAARLDELNIEHTTGVLDSPDPAQLGVLAQGIGDCELFVLLLSRDAYSSPMLNNVITYAFNKKRRESIMPYIVDGSSLPPAVEFVFAGINWRTVASHPPKELAREIAELTGHAPENTDFLAQGNARRRCGDYAGAIESFKAGAKNGSAACAYNLGILYLSGTPGVKDERLAFEWFRKAAGMGDVGAMRKVASCCYMGIGTEADKAESIRWLRKITLCPTFKEEYIWACNALSAHYANGDGVPCNPGEAARWAARADEMRSQ